MDALSRIRKELESGSPDLLRLLVKETAEALMRAEADALCNAAHGERTPERVNRRNGYRERDWDTRAGTVELQLPKLRTGSYFPDWLLVPRRRAEQALVSVVADMYLAGVSTGGSTSWSANSVWRASARARCRGWPHRWTSSSSSGGSGPWTPAPTPI